MPAMPAFLTVSTVPLRRCLAAGLAAAAIAVGAFAWGTGPAAAATSSPACYSQEEFNAEQAVRFHTQMMVVGLTCRNAVPNQDLFIKYKEFTNRHREALMRWEKVLIDHQRKMGANPTRGYDTFRTELANQLSRRSATMTSGTYCQFLAQGALAAEQLNDADLAALVNDDVVMRLASRPPCQPRSAWNPAAEGPVVLAASAAAAPPPPPPSATPPAPGKAPAKAAAPTKATPAKTPPAKDPKKK